MAGLQPHSRQEWLGLPQNKRGFKSYQRYRNWWETNVRRRTSGGTSLDYLAPIPQDRLLDMAGSSVRASLDPLVKEITDSFRRRSEEGSQKITSFNDRWFNSLGPMAQNMSNVYNQALQSEAAITGGITNFLSGAGNAAAADVTSQLQAINAPQEALDAQGGQLAALGTGIAGQALGRGSISMSLLNAEKAAEMGYQAKLPGITRQFGAEQLLDFQKGISGQQADALGEINSRVPGMVTDLYQNLLSKEVEKAIARRGFQMDEKKFAASTAPQPPGFDSGYSNFIGYAMDTNGQPILDANGNPIPKYEKPGSSKPGKLSQQGIGEARKVAQKIHENLMKRLQPAFGIGAPAGKDKQALVLAARRNAMLQVKSTLRSYYPDQSEEWLTTRAAEVLSGSGFPGAAAELLGAPTSQGGPVGGTHGTGKPAKPPKPPKPPAAPAPARDKPNAGRATNAQQQAQKKAQHEKAVMNNVGEFVVTQVQNGIGRPTAKKRTVQWLQQALPGYPYKRILAMAESAVRQVYGQNYLPAP